MHQNVSKLILNFNSPNLFIYPIFLMLTKNYLIKSNSSILKEWNFGCYMFWNQSCYILGKYSL